MAENGSAVSPSHLRSMLIRSLSSLMREMGKLENAREYGRGWGPQSLQKWSQHPGI